MFDMPRNCCEFQRINISHHFASKHANYVIKQSTKEREATAQRLMAYLQTQQNLSCQQTAFQESINIASFMLGFKLAKASKPLSEGDFLKECMVETAGRCVRRTNINLKKSVYNARQ